MRGATQKKIQPISYTQLERNLQSVPAMRRALKELERIIEDVAGGYCVFEERVKGGEHLPPQERVAIAKERSTEYQRYLKNISLAESAIESLSPDEKAFVEYYFWRDMSSDVYSHEVGVARCMDFSVRTVWRWRARLLEKLEPLMREFDPTLFWG